MEIHIGDRVADVTLVSKEGNKVQFMIDGKPYDVDIVMAENGSCSILHDGNSFNAELIRGEGGKSYDVNMFYRSDDKRFVWNDAPGDLIAIVSSYAGQIGYICEYED